MHTARFFVFLTAALAAIIGVEHPASASGEFTSQASAACSVDIARSCSNVKPGGGRIMQCLQDTPQTLTPDCKKEVMPDDGPTGTATIEVTVTGIQSNAGAVIVVLSDDPDKFPLGRRTVIVPVSGDKAVVNFRHLKPGTYAVMAIHDVNGNNNFDPNVTPSEAIGFSNNTTMVPSFDTSGFAVSRDTKIAVPLTYL